MDPTIPIELEPLDEPAKKVRTKEEISVRNDECLARRGSDSNRNSGLKTVTAVIGGVRSRRKFSIGRDLERGVVGEDRGWAAEVSTLVDNEQRITTQPEAHRIVASRGEGGSFNRGQLTISLNVKDCNGVGSGIHGKE